MEMNPRLKLTLAPVMLASLCFATLGGCVTLCLLDDDAGDLLRTFDSRSDLLEFIKGDRDSRRTYALPPSTIGYSEQAADSGGQLPYSETNVQTTGVDEPDFMKTDGKYIYTASSSQVMIVKAVPPELMELTSVISADDLFGEDCASPGHITGIFLRDDRLVILTQTLSRCFWLENESGGAVRECNPPLTQVWIYDTTDKSDPRPESVTGISGDELASRMIGDVVYVLAHLRVECDDEDRLLPRLSEEGVEKEVPLSSVKYDPTMQYPNAFVNLLAVDVSSGAHTSMSMVADQSSTVYMSAKSLYYAVQNQRQVLRDWGWWRGLEDAGPSKTSIYKISVEGLRMEVVARGDVRGWLLNQFSMDEYGGNLRVATTTSWSDAESAVYVLDEHMKTIGGLEGLAPRERIYSARFVGDTLYLVTFLQVDPLFVIDLSNPRRPAVLGELEVPGFSTYLHPVGDSHVLGIGEENGLVKVSLFDVTDPTAPSQVGKFVIEGYFNTPALQDHRAVLFDHERGLLVLPGSQWVEVFQDHSYSNYASPVAYVLRVSPSEGISLVGVISHDLPTDSSYGQIQRSLYIDDCLYTLSEVALQANLLDSLALAGKVTVDEHWDY